MAAELDKYRNYGERIEALIRPATFPLAVKRITSEAELEPEYKRPSRDMGLQNFVCQNFKGYLLMEGGVLEFSAAGRVGSCHEGVTKTIKTKKPQYVTLGNGDRVWGGAQDHEVMFSCPGEKLGLLVEGLEKTHAAGLRYPIPQYQNYSPGFQEKFEKAAVDRAGGTIEKK
ncbi:MAG: DUF169 domain-containing protein [Desulfobacterales bacterium]|nr:DUF169 domain-containing protein [Desulfobacterales bacterium]